MYWKTKTKPRWDDQRTVKKFAYLPVELSNGYTVWLDYYYIDQYWAYSYYGGYWRTIQSYHLKDL